MTYCEACGQWERTSPCGSCKDAATIADQRDRIKALEAELAQANRTADILCDKADAMEGRAKLAEARVTVAEAERDARTNDCFAMEAERDQAIAQCAAIAEEAGINPNDIPAAAAALLAERDGLVALVMAHKGAIARWSGTVDDPGETEAARRAAAEEMRALAASRDGLSE